MAMRTVGIIGFVAVVVLAVGVGGYALAQSGNQCIEDGAVHPNHAALAADCVALLAVKGTLEGSGELNWSSSQSIYRWEGLRIEGDPRRVTRVTIQRRELTGQIPAEIGRLDALVDFWAYDNELTGPLPTELGNLSALRTLMLKDNALSGQLPLSLNNLSLDRLWLRGNQFTGCVPANLANTPDNDLSYVRLPLCVSDAPTPTPQPPVRPYGELRVSHSTITVGRGGIAEGYNLSPPDLDTRITATPPLQDSRCSSSSVEAIWTRIGPEPPADVTKRFWGCSVGTSTVSLMAGETTLASTTITVEDPLYNFLMAGVCTKGDVESAFGSAFSRWDAIPEGGWYEMDRNGRGWWLYSRDVWISDVDDFEVDFEVDCEAWVYDNEWSAAVDMGYSALRDVSDDWLLQLSFEARFDAQDWLSATEVIGFDAFYALRSNEDQLEDQVAVTNVLMRPDGDNRVASISVRSWSLQHVSTETLQAVMSEVRARLAGSHATITRDTIGVSTEGASQVVGPQRGSEHVPADVIANPGRMAPR